MRLLGFNAVLMEKFKHSFKAKLLKAPGIGFIDETPKNKHFKEESQQKLFNHAQLQQKHSTTELPLLSSIFLHHPNFHYA